MRSIAPGAALPFAERGASSSVTSHFDFTSSNVSGMFSDDESSLIPAKLPTGATIHGKRKVDWRRDVFPTTSSSLSPRFFHVSPGSYLVLAHSLDLFNAPPVMKVHTADGGPPTNTMASHTLHSWTMVLDVRIHAWGCGRGTWTCCR